MVDPVSTNLSLALPLHGSNTDTWDQPLNANASILDAVAGSVTTKSLTNIPVTLTTTESRVNILRFSGTLTGSVPITLGAVIKSWIVENNTTGNFIISVQGSGGQFCCLPPGQSQIYWDGTNVKFMNLSPSIGGYWDYAGSAVPAWVSTSSVPPFLLCDGSTFSAVTYPQLNQILGGTTLPDHRGRSRFALDGGTGRLTSAGSGVDGTTVRASGGSQSQSILQGNLPNYNLVSSSLSISDTRTWATGANVIQQNNVGPNTGLGGSVWAPGAVAVTVTGGSISIGGTVPSGGSGTPLVTVPPALVGGITMIRAA